VLREDYLEPLGMTGHGLGMRLRAASVAALIGLTVVEAFQG
jgi:hypothetical protein